jgi:hypothetical protein
LTTKIAKGKIAHHFRSDSFTFGLVERSLGGGLGETVSSEKELISRLRLVRKDRTKSSGYERHNHSTFPLRDARPQAGCHLIKGEPFGQDAGGLPGFLLHPIFLES